MWRKERLQSILYKAVKHEDVEMAAKCLKMGTVDVNNRYEPVRARSFIKRMVVVVDQKVLLDTMRPQCRGATYEKRGAQC